MLYITQEHINFCFDFLIFFLAVKSKNWFFVAVSFQKDVINVYAIIPNYYLGLSSFTSTLIVELLGAEGKKRT